MQFNTTSTVLLALVAGAVGAGVATLLLQLPDSSPAAADQVGLQPEAPPTSATREEFGAMRQELEELSRRLTSLEMRPPVEPPMRVPVEGTAREIFEEKVQGFMAAVESGETVPENFNDQVVQALEAIRAEERDDSQRAAEEKRDRRREATLSKLSAELDLSAWQVGEMRKFFVSREEANQDIKTRYQAGDDPALLGEQKRANRDTQREILERTLTPEQLETYDARRAAGRGK